MVPLPFKNGLCESLSLSNPERERWWTNARTSRDGFSAVMFGVFLCSGITSQKMGDIVWKRGLCVNASLFMMDWCWLCSFLSFFLHLSLFSWHVCCSNASATLARSIIFIFIFCCPMNEQNARSIGGGRGCLVSFFLSLSRVKQKAKNSAMQGKRPIPDVFFLFDALISVCWIRWCGIHQFSVIGADRAPASRPMLLVFLFFSAWLSVWRPIDQLLSHYDPLALFLSWLRSAAKKHTPRSSCELVHNT